MEIFSNQAKGIFYFARACAYAYIEKQIYRSEKK